ncbi:KPN_02809 family neutral zinc metallopeptidase [Flexivirga meconopsidis]|uniref:KPN_02809 family neutral zinc metallopeptidase n=1 Tax=Flexivirga meconopsidis TaxID=2977121 RepID=UPI00224095DE
MTFNDNADISGGNVGSGGSGGGGGGGLGGGMMPGGIAVGGIGGVILMILMVLFGGNITGDPNSGTGGAGGAGQINSDPNNPYGGNQIDPGNDSIQQQLDQCTTGKQANDNDTCLIKATVASVEGFWKVYLPTATQQQYSPAKTIVYSGSTSSGCGQASSAMGPFYCPVDKQVYVDAGFFQELQSQYGSDGGQLAKEYVLAHEYGHHVQDILGLLGRAQQDPQGEQSGSVRTELQADCLGGVWAAYADGSKKDKVKIDPLLKPLTSKDIDSALSAAAAVGDDRIQQKAQGRVTPETWTHGSSAARQKWFKTGYDSGDINQCNTFDVANVE